MISKIDLVVRLINDGTFSDLLRTGLISWKIARDKDIFLTYDVKIRTGKKTSVAIQETATEFDVEPLMVRRAIKTFVE